MFSGGKLLDEGSYGCIFTPVLQCKNKKEPIRDDNHPPISKLILTDSANLEYSISKIIRQIPLWKNYFVVSESICEPSPIQKDKDISKCGIIDNHKLSDFRILTMPYGGKSLNTYRININNFDFMEFVIHFIEAGAVLNLFGIVHRDIHQGNILVDDEQVPRIIDFNLAIPINKKVSSSDLDHTYNYITGQEPPDSTLVNAINLGYKSERVINSLIDKKPIMRKIRSILGVSQYEQHLALDKFYSESKSVKAGDYHRLPIERKAEA